MHRLERQGLGHQRLLQHPRAGRQVPADERKLDAPRHAVPVHLHVQVPGPDAAVQLSGQPGLLRVPAVQQLRLHFRDVRALGDPGRMADSRDIRVRVHRPDLHLGPAVPAARRLGGRHPGRCRLGHGRGSRLSRCGARGRLQQHNSQQHAGVQRLEPRHHRLDRPLHLRCPHQPRLRGLHRARRSPVLRDRLHSLDAAGHLRRRHLLHHRHAVLLQPGDLLGHLRRGRLLRRRGQHDRRAQLGWRVHRQRGHGLQRDHQLLLARL